jgi:hypothetical protein
MSTFKAMLDTYPVLSVLIGDLLAVAVAFGVGLSEAQVVAIMAVVTTLGQVLAHTRVTPVPPEERGF